MKQHTIILQVLAEESEDLLLELANDERVKAITMHVGDSKYVVPSREKVA